MMKATGLKRLLAVVAAGVLMVSSAVAVFAQPSVSVDGNTTVSGVTDANGNTVSFQAIGINDSNLTAEQIAIVNSILSADGLQSIMGANFTSSMKVLDLKYMVFGATGTASSGSRMLGPVSTVLGRNVSGKVTATRNVLLANKTAGVAYPVSASFGVSGVTANTKAFAYTFNEDTNAWEQANTTVGNGTLTVAMNYNGAVALVVDQNTLGNAGGSGSGSGSGAGSGSGSSAQGSTASTKAGAANTSDNSNIALYVTLASAAIVVIGAGIIIKNRKKAK